VDDPVSLLLQSFKNKNKVISPLVLTEILKIIEYIYLRKLFLDGRWGGGGGFNKDYQSTIMFNIGHGKICLQNYYSATFRSRNSS